LSESYCYLTMITGPRAGTNYLLNPDSVTSLGRGIDCDVVLADPLCSRVQAELEYVNQSWRLTDAGSRNGSFVNDDQIEKHVLKSGDVVRLGSTEFTFQARSQPPTLALTRDNQVTESIVREAQVDSADSGKLALAALRHTDNARDLLLLYQLSVKLLGCDDPSEVIRSTLKLIHERTNAAFVGFLWVSEHDDLIPKIVIPEQSDRPILLSQTLTELVLEQKRAVWIANQASAAGAESLRSYADALCVPLIHDRHILGALHMYLMQGSFREIDFEFGISVGHVLGVALARSRRQAKLTTDHERLVANTAAFDELIGESDPMKRLKSTVARVAQAAGCVLVRGESGCGKELVARAVHQAGPRADRPMLAVNCAAIPANLVESELFGHVKGSFSGATSDRVGWFQQADTGTLFLDEIGELPMEAQAKLLRILEGHPFLPVGGEKEIAVDVRMIAATNRDLRELVREKLFREDLFYRLSVFELYVPPLREREGDIELLLDHFFSHFRRQHGRPALDLSESARLRLLDYEWPGNVRQLRNVIDSAVVMASEETIQPGDLGLYDAGTDQLDSLRIEDWEKRLIRAALERTDGSVPEAAKLLGIGRATLYRKIDEYEIKRQ